MSRNTLIRILLAPLSLLYGIGVSIRNFLYSKSLLKGVKFDTPVIAVGNLSMGGTGKTPHVEYLIRLLQDYIYVATLSRGYKRKTRGFRIANDYDDVKTIGDEPLQFYHKFPKVKVAVAESRMLAIPRLMGEEPHLQTILLDDAFQHRSVKPSLNILLTAYQSLFTRDWLLPSGRLREWRTAYHRADVIIVSKCPDQLTAEQREAIIQEIRPLAHQRIFFSKYEYQRPYRLFGTAADTVEINKSTNILVVCALANASYLVDYLAKQAGQVQNMEYPDHHYYSNYDMSRILNFYKKWSVENKIIITTEKDAKRLALHRDFILENDIKIYVLPAFVSFLGADKKQFDTFIKDFLLAFEV